MYTGVHPTCTMYSYKSHAALVVHAHVGPTFGVQVLASAHHSCMCTRQEKTMLVVTALCRTFASACPQILSNTCYRVHKDSYNSGPAELEDCCKQCEADGQLCQGFTVTASGNCNLLDQWNETNVYHGAGCSSGRVHNNGKLPLPPTIKPAPHGAKNVLFLVADDMRPSIGPYASPAQRKAGAFSTPAFGRTRCYRNDLWTSLRSIFVLCPVTQLVYERPTA